MEIIGYFFASTSQLEIHKRIKRQQVSLAGDLVRAIQRLCAAEGFQADERYRLLEKKANESLEFANAMSAFLDDFQDQVQEASLKTKKMLADTIKTNEERIRVR